MSFSVLQWNVWYKEEPDNIVACLREHPADVICLQELVIDEASQRHVPNFVAHRLGYHHFFQELPLESTDGTKLHLANGIFSRFPIKKSRAVWINKPKGEGGYDDEYRAYVEVALDIDGREITVGTTHMSYTHRFEPTPNKHAETDRLTAEIAKHPSNYVFMGDLNALPGSYTINSIGKLLKNAGPDDTHKTWATKPFDYNGFSESKLQWRLDYIFTSPDLHVTKSEVLTSKFSDHLPVFARLD